MEAGAESGVVRMEYMQLAMPGLRVRFTENSLGLIGTPGVVNADDLGTVVGPGMEPEWIYVEPDGFPGTICPVHVSMIEAV